MKGKTAKVSFNKLKKKAVKLKAGKITVKKGLKKGTYKIKIKVRAAGNDQYKRSEWKKVTCKIKVR